jgi:hypothetical protein
MICQNDTEEDNPVAMKFGNLCSLIHAETTIMECYEEVTEFANGDFVDSAKQDVQVCIKLMSKD